MQRLAVTGLSLGQLSTGHWPFSRPNSVRGLADVVAQVVAQVSQIQLGHTSGQQSREHQNGRVHELERLGDAIPGTGYERGSSSSNVEQGTLIAPSFLGIVNSDSTAAGLGQTQAENNTLKARLHGRFFSS